jgi:hypothetical protein
MIIVESRSWFPTIRQASPAVMRSNNIDGKAVLLIEGSGKRRPSPRKAAEATAVIVFPAGIASTAVA